MKRKIFCLAAAIATAVTLAAVEAPIEAGVVYVPVEAKSSGDQTRVWVSNTGNDPASFESTFIPLFTDGTARDSWPEPVVRSLPPGGTVMIAAAPEGAQGMLELVLHPAMRAEARLVKAGQPAQSAVGAAVPVISSTNSASAGDLHLQGWQRASGGAVTTDFSLVNLGHEATTCFMVPFAASGAALEVFELPFRPLSISHFGDVLGFLGIDDIAHVRLRVTCDQPFYVYARVAGAGGTQFITPSAGGDSLLTRPGSTAPPPPGCGEGVLCFSRPGVFYAPTPSESVRRETFPVPPGSYSKLHFRVEVVHGGWRSPTSGLHSLFWLAINGHFRLIGFSGFHGPNKNDLLFRHGMNLLAGDKAKFVPSFNAVPGETYVCDFLFDPAGRHLQYTVSDLAGNVLLSITDRPNVNRIHIEQGDVLMADFSTRAGQNPIEPPTYGWQYKNLTLEVYP
jgi:hypothetical protein